MGINIHALNFLMYASKKKKFGSTATIGRQTITYLKAKEIKNILHLPKEVDYGTWCEKLLIDNFHASKVDSFDYSDYEGCTFTHDMNNPLPPAMTTPNNKYDTIIDIGSFEHIYNLPQAFKNISTMCKDGGIIIHILPANNMNGHGFWQFSPELFYSLYSESNGYTETEVFFADHGDTKYWYNVKKPENGNRCYVSDKKKIFVMIRTKKIKEFTHENVQESHFIQAWNQKNSNVGNGLIKKLEGFAKRHESFFPFMYYIYIQLHFIKNPEKLSGRNKNLVKRKVTDWMNI